MNVTRYPLSVTHLVSPIPMGQARGYGPLERRGPQPGTAYRPARLDAIRLGRECSSKPMSPLRVASRELRIAAEPSEAP